MAGDRVSVLIDIAVKGRELVRGASDDISKLEGAGTKASSGLGKMAVTLGAAAGVIAGAAIAAKQLYGALREGAQLETTIQRFDKLSASIGTTADVMLGQLKSATQGMISDAELMASASQIMSLKLADNSEQVIRLATVAGTLGWDMQQVILTFANLSTMRLDALGLGVTEVTTKAKELEAAGMSAAEAFKEAVILAGEARLEIGGVSEQEKAFKQAEAAITNYKNSILQSTIATLDQAGAFDALAASAANLSGFASFTTEIERMKQAGELTQAQWATLNAIIRRGGVEAAEAALKHMQMKDMLYATGEALGTNQGAWAKWAATMQSQVDTAAEGAIYTIDQVMRSVIQADAILMQTVSNWRAGKRDTFISDSMASGMNGLPYLSNDRYQAGIMGRIGMDYDRVTASVGAYGGAVSQATSAEMALAAAHASLVDTFNAEITAKLEDGLIDASGVVNIENANKAMMEQARIAGFTAGEMAILGVAIGAYTQEQAQAALKAAILQEKMKQIAAQAVATGDIAGAASAFQAFQGQLDTGQITGAAGSIEALAGAADSFAGDYQASLSVEDRAAMDAINATQAALNALTSGTYVINLSTVTTGSLPPIQVDNRGAVNRAEVVSGRSGGAAYNINVTNYIDGKEQSRSSVDDVTTDRLMAALKGLGVRS